MFESAGVDDRPLLELLQRKHSIALVHVHAPRELCVERVTSRRSDRNIHHTTDRERMGRHYDLWHSRVLPTYHFSLTVAGDDVAGACCTIREFLGGSR